MKPSKDEQQVLALWAADCAAHVLACFESKCPDDERPRLAMEAGRAWARGEISVGAARAAAIAAHGAARDTQDAAAAAAARAAGHAAATAHMAGHARHAANYAIAAITHVAGPAHANAAAGRERDWQRERLAEALWPLAFAVEDGSRAG